ASPSLAARTAAISRRPGKRGGKGSIPPSRSACAFARRSPIRLCRPPAGGAGSSAVVARLDVDDLVLEGAARRRDRHLLALLLAEQRLAHRALVGEAVVARIGLGGADDRVLARRLALHVLERDAGADRDRLGRDVLGVDDAGVAELLLEGLDA